DGARAGRTEEDGISRKLANRGGRRIQVDREARSGRGGYRKLVRAQRVSRNWGEADTLWGLRAARQQLKCLGPRRCRRKDRVTRLSCSKRTGTGQDESQDVSQQANQG